MRKTRFENIISFFIYESIFSFINNPSDIVFKIKRWVMCVQAFLLKTKFITLVNLIATSDIKKRTWGPYDPDAKDAEEVMMPEYLTTGNPSASVAGRAIRWLNDDGLRLAKEAELDVLASRFAIPGATNQAADYLLKQLGVPTIALPGADEAVGEFVTEPSTSRKSA